MSTRPDDFYSPTSILSQVIKNDLSSYCSNDITGSVDCPVDCVDGRLIVRFVHLVSNIFDMNDAIIGFDDHNGTLQQTSFFDEHPILLAELAFVIFVVISLRILWGMAGS